MTNFVFDVVSSVFRPGIAVFAIVAGVAIISFDNTSLAVGSSAITLHAPSCTGLLKPVCQLVSF